MKKFIYNSIMVMASIAMVLSIASCGEDDEVKPDGGKGGDKTEKTLKLDQATATIAEGDTLKLVATVTPDGEEVLWTTSDSLVAVVNGGAVIARAEGKAVITATLANDTTKNAYCAVTVINKATAAVVGTWKVKSFEQTAATMQSDCWYDMITNWSGFPEKNDADRITFTADGKIVTDLSSTLKNYFQAESNFKVVDMEVAIHVGNSIGNVAKPTILELDNVNRYFSATEQSEDKVAYLGVQPNADNDELLDVFIIDYDSRSFAYPDFDDWMMYNATKPTATVSGTYILFTMERVVEE